jgi:L-amino acid N-acyltransferase YncA
MYIRPLIPADAPTFRVLRLRALKDHPEAFTSSFEEDTLRPPSWTEQRLAGGSGDMFWGCFVGDALHGIIGLNRESRDKNRHKGNVVAMYVAPEVGRRGMARALLQAVIDHARDDGVLEQLVLTVTQGNRAARDLYHDVGFRTFGVEPRAINVGGKYFDKEHMIYFLQRQP